MLKKTALTAAVTLFADPAFSDNIRIIVPYSAGDPLEQIARIIAPALQEETGATVIVEDIPGAGGMIGMTALAQAEPDGMTLALTGQGHVLSALTQVDKLAYKPLDSFTPIALVAKMPAVLVVNKDLGVDNLDQLIALAKKRALHFGSSGVGNSPHLAGEMLNEQAGITAVHVPFPGMAPIIADVMVGNVYMVVADLPVVVPHVKSGNLKALAIFGAERTDVLPDVATSAEQGYPGLVTGNYYYFLGLAGMKEDKRAALESTVSAALKQPDIEKLLIAAGVNGLEDGAVLHRMLEAEFIKWKPLVDRLDLATKQ
jgi:tripartite-type tricarboxylate transporter receptor subunit TctC